MGFFHRRLVLRYEWWKMNSYVYGQVGITVDVGLLAPLYRTPSLEVQFSFVINANKKSNFFSSSSELVVLVENVQMHTNKIRKHKQNVKPNGTSLIFKYLKARYVRTIQKFTHFKWFATEKYLLYLKFARKQERFLKIVLVLV